MIFFWLIMSLELNSYQIIISCKHMKYFLYDKCIRKLFFSENSLQQKNNKNEKNI